MEDAIKKLNVPTLILVENAVIALKDIVVLEKLNVRKLTNVSQPTAVVIVEQNV
jgi:hypothetical protein